jgi:hypothetical protein
MSLLRRRRLFVGLVVAAAAALLAGPLAQSASAATFFRTVNSASAKTQLAISSSQNNAPLEFVPEFKGTFVCATCGIAGIPDKQLWSLEKLVPESRNIFLVNRQTKKCADVELAAQAPGADALGAKVVIAPCDGTVSQRWKHIFSAGGNQSTFQNELTGLILTNNAAEGVVLEDFANVRTVTERLQHVQTFGSTRSNIIE